MATHSSVLAWRIPGTGEPGGLPSMGSHRVGHDWSDAATAAVHFSSVAQSRLTLWDPMDCSRPDLPVHHQLLEFTQTHLRSVSDAIQPTHPLLSLSPPASIFSSIRVFSNESALCIRWPLEFSISTPNEYSGLISFRMDWLALLAVQGTLKSLHQHHSSKASILHAQLSVCRRPEYSKAFVPNS